MTEIKEVQAQVQYFGGVLGPLTTREVGVLRYVVDTCLKAGVELNEDQQNVVEKADAYFKHIVDENTKIGMIP